MDKQNSCRPSSSLRIPAPIRANPLFWPYIRHTLAAGKSQPEQPRKEKQISLKRKIEIPHKPERLVIDLDEEENEHSILSRKNPRLMLKEKQSFANATVERFFVHQNPRMDKQNSCRPSSSLRIPARIRANPLFWPYIRHTLAAGKSQPEQPRKEKQISLKRKIEIPHKPERLVIDLDEEENEHSILSRKNPRLMLKEKQSFANATVDREREAGKKFSTNKYNKSWEPNINKHQSQLPSSTSTSTFAGSEVAHVSAGYSSLAMAAEGLSVATNLTSLKHYSPQDEEEERRNGVSTRLKLYEDPWKIKKILKHDDIRGNQCWIMVVSGSVVKEHVLKFLSNNLVSAIDSNANGGRFDFWDIDTKFMHKLVLKKLIDTTYYVLIERWSQDFVKRRNLSAGDQIGFCWDTYHSRFNFCVLTRANTLHQYHTPSLLFN